jgi:PAS domain S-box-containing protein
MTIMADQPESPLENLYNHAPCGLHSVDANGHFLMINDTELQWLGYSRDEVLGKIKFSDLLTQHSVESFKNNFQLFKNQGFIKETEYEIFRKNGSTFWISLSATAIYDKMGNYVRSRTTMVDLTYRRQLEAELVKKNEQLELLNQEKNHFIGVASHDLQNPITNLRLLAAKFRRTNQTLTDRQKEWIEDLDDTALRMSALIHNMLNVSRIEQDSLLLQIEEIDLSGLLTGLVHGFKHIADRKQITLKTDIPQGIKIQSDVIFLSEIFENLVSNAIKFSPPKKSVQVSVLDVDTYLKIEIEDAGAGIATDELPLLFQKFRKLSSRPTAGESSSGLGLAIVKEYVEKLGGSVYYKPARVTGAIFVVELPK